MAQPSVHGRFIWQELVTDDMAGAGSFYSKVIGWRLQAGTHPGGRYSILATERGGVGGVTSLTDEARQSGGRAHWLPYVGAENVDATAAKAERHGGRIVHAASDIEDVGRYAVLTDPQGATFGIYRPRSPAAADKSPARPGEVAWQELATSDLEGALRFYGELFGWQVLRRMEMGSAGTYVIFGRDGVQQGGMHKLSAQVPAPYWLTYIEVADTQATADAAREAGARLTNGPMDVPGGRVAHLLDPQGVPFAVHTASPPAATAGTPAASGAAPAGESGHAPASAPRPARRARPAPAAGAAPTAAAKVKPSTPEAAKPAAEAPRKASPKPAAKAPGKASRKATRKAQQKTTRRAAKKAAKKAPKKAPRKASRKAVPRRTAKQKAAKKAARRAGSRSAPRASGRTARKGRR